MKASFKGVMNAAALDSRPSIVPVTVSGVCLIYYLDDVCIPMRLKSGLVVAKEIHSKEAHRATKADFTTTMSSCKNKGWAVGENSLDN